MSYGRHRAPREPRWHDRPRAWLRTAWDWARGGREEEEQPLTDDHGNDIGADLPPVQRWPQPERPLIRTAEVGGVYLPLSGDPNPWAPCWARQDVPRPGTNREDLTHVRRPDAAPGVAGPGYLSAFASPFGAPGRIPPTPRPPREPVTWWRPRECGGRITALAGA